ncbi:MAG: preprotein translocase subunit SecG [Deltaproteobacteria bacterium]|nr:MAG: preprotein translocase subunit SecG [Deltaproteobacteria bacterium]
MQLFVTILHVFLCLALILIILLQPGKEGAAAFGGGGGNQMYGPRGQGHVLGKVTTLVAGLFMFTSITLAWYSSERAKTDTDLEEGIDQVEFNEEGFDVAVPESSSGNDTPARDAGPEQPPADDASDPGEEPTGDVVPAP